MLKGEVWLWMIPFALIGLYTIIFYRKAAFLFLAFGVGISINYGEMTNAAFGLYIPTEPVCIGLMFLLLFESLQKPVFPRFVFNHLITLSIIAYISICVLATITSEMPVVSIKFILAKLWFIIPFVFFGPRLFGDLKFINRFLWSFVIGMSITMIFTLIKHSASGFGDEEGHQVMYPFFNDHTIYGCLVAFLFPVNILLVYWHKTNFWLRTIAVFLLGLTTMALIFSYTRAAWVSVIGAGGILILIHYRVKFKYLAGIFFIVVSLVAFNWTSISQKLAKNKSEHTTTNIGERFESAANVTTDASNLERINRWSCAIAMANDRPFLGFGPGTYAFQYAPYQEPENKTIISTNFGHMGNAHSEYLGPLAETGFLGLIAVLVMVGCIFYSSITCYIHYRKTNHQKATVLLCIIASFSTFFIHGILNNYWDTDKISIPVFAFCAIVIAFDQARKSDLAQN
jgi:putative inorganic carbon (hco3(-)) transporter